MERVLQKKKIVENVKRKYQRRKKKKKKLTLSPQIVLRDHVRKVNATRLSKLHAVLSRMTRKNRVSGNQFEIAGIWNRKLVALNLYGLGEGCWLEDEPAAV